MGWREERVIMLTLSQISCSNRRKEHISQTAEAVVVLQSGDFEGLLDD